MMTKVKIFSILVKIEYFYIKINQINQINLMNQKEIIVFRFFITIKKVFFVFVNYHSITKMFVSVLSLILFLKRIYSYLLCLMKKFIKSVNRIFKDFYSLLFKIKQNFDD
jgi:hypothetical protein